VLAENGGVEELAIRLGGSLHLPILLDLSRNRESCQIAQRSPRSTCWYSGAGELVARYAVRGSYHGGVGGPPRHGRSPGSARPNNKPSIPVSFGSRLSEGVLPIDVITGFDQLICDNLPLVTTGWDGTTRPTVHLFASSESASKALTCSVSVRDRYHPDDSGGRAGSP
jgi:hypothetical protein